VILKVVYPFEGVVTEDKVKMSASDLLANEEGIVRMPHDIDIVEAIHICDHYGCYTFAGEMQDE